MRKTTAEEIMETIIGFDRWMKKWGDWHKANSQKNRSTLSPEKNEPQENKSHANKQ